MFDMTDVQMADMLAGGPREDLDDVILGERRCPVYGGVYRVPDEIPLLDFLQQQVENRETMAMFERFYENPDGRDWDVIAAEVRHDTDGPLGPRKVTRMFNDYGESVYLANPHLQMLDVWLHLREMGFTRSKWCFYKHMARQGHSGTARSRVASSTPNATRAVETAR